MKKALLLLILLISTVLSGCWSSKEIEDLSLNVGIAIDDGDQLAEEMRHIDQVSSSQEKGDLAVTFQYINTSATTPDSKGGGQKQFTNVSAIGNTNHQNIRVISLREENPIMFHHTKVIVVSGELLKKIGIREIMDFYLRDSEARLSCLVLVSKGPAKDTLQSKDPAVIPSFRLLGIVDNAYRSSRILNPMTLAKIQGESYSKSSYLLQNVYTEDGEVKFSGAGIMRGKTNKLIGYISEDDLTGITLITGDAKGGPIPAFEKQSGKPMVYEIETIKSKIIPHVKRGKISFDIKIDSEGILSENWKDSKEPSEKIASEAEELIKEEMEKTLARTLKKTQKHYKVDVVGFDNELRIKYPKTWNRVKDDWDATFAELPIKYSIKVKIINYGNTDARS